MVRVYSINQVTNGEYHQWLLNNLNISSCASLRSLQTESAKERLGLGCGQIRLGC